MKGQQKVITFFCPGLRGPGPGPPAPTKVGVKGVFTPGLPLPKAGVKGWFTPSLPRPCVPLGPGGPGPPLSPFWWYFGLPNPANQFGKQFGRQNGKFIEFNACNFQYGYQKGDVWSWLFWGFNEHLHFAVLWFHPCYGRGLNTYDRFVSPLTCEIFSLSSTF